MSIFGKIFGSSRAPDILHPATEQPPRGANVILVLKDGEKATAYGNEFEGWFDSSLGAFYPIGMERGGYLLQEELEGWRHVP